MKIFNDVFAGWSFRCGVHSLSYNDFKLLSEDKYFIIINKIINELGKVITRLEEFKIFSVRSLRIGKKHFLISPNDSLVNVLLELIANHKDERQSELSLKGVTYIYEGSILKEYNDIIVVTCEFYLDLISIDTYSDIWLPFDWVGEDINLTRARINSNRLETCLMTIKNLALFSEIEPDEGEVYCGYSARQKGFRLYYPPVAFSDFPEDEVKNYSEFILDDLEDKEHSKKDNHLT